MNLETELYLIQNQTWPQKGRHILAQFDDSSVLVYQAYNVTIGSFAAKNGFFGGDFSFSRMSWFKPNFLWMMYRSGWGTKANQEVTLAIRTKREFFERVLDAAVPSIRGGDDWANHDEWKRAIANSDVRLQWDPDHGSSGAPLQRRAIQLGLRGEFLREYGRAAILEIADISEFVAEQRQNLDNLEILKTPREHIFTPQAESTK